MQTHACAVMGQRCWRRKDGARIFHQN